LTRNFVFFDQAATTADDSERMKKVLQNKSEEDEKRMVQLEEQLKEARYTLYKRPGTPNMAAEEVPGMKLARTRLGKFEALTI
jgi:hypothetical protein